ncbi:MAG: SpoIIE family protein phosphatase [Candidatus Acidiferrales bacterium]
MDPIDVNTHFEIDTEAQAAVPVSPEALATMVEIGEEINASLDLDHVLGRAAALIRRLIEYEIFAVLLLDERTGQLAFRFAIGHRPEIVENMRIALGQGVTGRAAAQGQPVLVRDVSQEPNYINVLDSVRSELAVPLMFKGRCIGVLDIQSRQLNYFHRSHQDILTLLASRLAGAIENARLYERTRQQAETLLLLNEVGREASSILDVNVLLERAAELVRRIIDYQILSLVLYDEKRNAFTRSIDVKYGRRVQAEIGCGGCTPGIVGAALALKKPVVVPDVAADPRYVNVNPETRSELAVPLIHKDRVLGVLDLESPQLNYFTEDHVHALSILAGQLAVSIQNARLYEQVARDEARMERELRAARRIQSVMLPQLPKEDFGLDLAVRYVSARELGGDLYDFIRYGPQQLAFLLGDASGKGTAAALYGAVAAGIIRSLAPLKLQPAELLRRVNQFVGEHKVEDRFMTACYATWQRGRRRMRIASAGQSQPLLYRDGQCAKLPLTGLPLGIFDDVTYEDWNATLHPGEIVLFYSDGLTDGFNPSGEDFGSDRLCRLLEQHAAASADEVADRLMTEASRFSTGAHVASALARNDDDRTLLVVKVR